MKPSHTMIATLLFTSMGSIGLLLLRIIMSGKSTYNFMVLNLALAWIPFLISTALVYIWKNKKIYHRNIVLTIGFVLWVLFIPNAPYMLTDFIHLKVRDNTPLWFDVIFFQTYTLVGLMLGTVSVLQIESMVKEKFGKKLSVYLSILFFFIISSGVSLGRFFRFNSWDVFVAPSDFLQTLRFSFISPYLWIESVAFSIFFFFFLVGAHYLFKTIHEWKHS